MGIDMKEEGREHALGYGQAERTYGQWWDWQGTFARVDLDEIEQLCIECLVTAGLDATNAKLQFSNTFGKLLQGDHARGLVYFPGLVRRVQAMVASGADPAGTVEVLRNKGATALVGGTGAVNEAAMELAIDKARQYGVAIVGSQQPGRILSPYVKMATEAGMVGLLMTQTAPCAAPFGGTQPMLGNGPMAIGIPVEGRDPVIVDMSFTGTSASGVLLAASQGASIPEGLLLDKHGRPTTDSTQFSSEPHDRAGSMTVSGSLTPLGNSHKGYAMLFAIGALASTLTATDFPWDLEGYPKGGLFGTIHLAINPEFLTGSGIEKRMATFVETLAASPRQPAVSRILYPGQRSQEIQRERRRRGWSDVPQQHLATVIGLARELGVTVPEGLGRAAMA